MPPVFASWEVTSIMGLHGPSESQSSFGLTTIAGAGPTQKRHKTTLAAAQKSCGRALGEARPRAIRSGTGRGGDVTGSRVSVISSPVVAAAARANPPAAPPHPPPTLA